MDEFNVSIEYRGVINSNQRKILEHNGCSKEEAKKLAEIIGDEIDKNWSHKPSQLKVGQLHFFKANYKLSFGSPVIPIILQARVEKVFEKSHKWVYEVKSGVLMNRKKQPYKPDYYTGK